MSCPLRTEAERGCRAPETRVREVVSYHVKSNQGLQKSNQRSSPLSPSPAPYVFLYGVSPGIYMVFIPCTVFSESVPELACFDPFQHCVCMCTQAWVWGHAVWSCRPGSSQLTDSLLLLSPSAGIRGHPHTCFIVKAL